MNIDLMLKYNVDMKTSLNATVCLWVAYCNSSVDTCTKNQCGKF